MPNRNAKEPTLLRPAFSWKAITRFDLWPMSAIAIFRQLTGALLRLKDCRGWVNTERGVLLRLLLLPDLADANAKL